MIMVLQIAGIVAVLVGLVTIGVGVPVKEFSFGNTLILSGTVGLCSGLIMLGLSVVAMELRQLARRLAAVSRPAAEPRARPALPPFPGAPEPAAADMGPAAPSITPAAPPTPAPEPAAPQKPKRNLLFQSNVRKERAADPAAGDTPPSPPSAPPAAPEPAAAQPASFDDAWPRTDRAGRPGEAPPRRSSRLSERTAEPGAGAAPEAPPVPAPAKPDETKPAVTVLKSGVVDGMAYSLYSDGSIEAQMPEGLMRFASIDELRAHLDQRPA